MNKRIMAARAAANPTITGRHGVIEMPVLDCLPFYAGKQRKAVRMTAIQRDSAGHRSAWSRSPYTPRGGWR